MADLASEHPVQAPQSAAVLVHLSWLDRFLPLWILLAMAGGLLLGRLVPGLQAVLGAVQVDHTSQGLLRVKQSSGPETVLANPAVPEVHGCHGPERPALR